MNNWRLLSVIFILLRAGWSQAQLIDVDFNWNESQPNPGPTMFGAAVLGAAADQWNGIDVNSGSGLPLLYANGNPSSVTMRFTSSGGYGGSTPFAGTPYDALMVDYLFANTAQTITLSGLAPNTLYNLILYNAGDTNIGAGGRTTLFTVNGLTQSSVWDGATSNFVAGVDYVEFRSVAPDSFGNLIITYKGDGLSGEGDVDGFQIQAIPNPFALGANSSGTNVTLSFLAQSGFNYQVQFATNLTEAAWTPLNGAIPGSNALQLVNDSVSGDGRYYRLQMVSNAPVSFSLLHTSNTDIVNADGRVVQLQGLNLGGWFIMEKWMCPLDNGNLPDTYSVITNLDKRFGVATEQSLIHTYQTNWITTRDLDNISNAGFNCVRMPVWWGNFYSITNTTSSGWRTDAFSVLDWLVTNCAARHIYVVIDMHGVVGGQSTSDDTGWQNQNQYWTNAIDQSETAYLWTQLASHYRGNPAVAGYDLINEPDGSSGTGEVWPVYASLYSTIRAVDPGHICIIEGTFENWDWDMLPAPATYQWTNIVYSMHEYQYGGTIAQIETGSYSQIVDFCDHNAWNVPCYIGEWNDMGQGAACYDFSINDYNSAGVSWTMWAYKATDGLVPDGWGWYDPAFWPATPNIASDSASVISNDWQQWQTVKSFGVNSTVGF